MMNFVISDDYNMLDERPILYPLTGPLVGVVQQLMPNARDLDAEAKRVIRDQLDGIEFMSCKAGARQLEIDFEDCSWTAHRSRIYGNLYLSTQDFELRDIDAIRGQAMAFARAFGRRIADEVAKPRLIASTGMACVRSPTVEIIHSLCPHNVDMVLVSDVTDEVVLRFAARFFVTPQGGKERP